MPKFKIEISERTLHFRHPAGTSRGIYTIRHSYYITLTSDRKPGIKGVGECAPLPDLSCDKMTGNEEYRRTLRSLCDMFCITGEINYMMFRPYPSMLFGLESALAQWQADGSTRIFDTPFGRGEEGITINGLVWMGTLEEMSVRLKDKLDQGFHCVKLKIGALDFNRELDLVKYIRQSFNKEQVELRVDANGGFSPENAMERLTALARYDIHSIEQPVRQHQWKYMARLCRDSPVPIALDEELIGVNMPEMKEELLDVLHPAYLVLKPSLHGGMSGCEEWIRMAEARGVGSWITSALESNVGLNAIAHFCARMYGPNIQMAQGLGTGMLFTDNISMPLEIKGNKLWYHE